MKGKVLGLSERKDQELDNITWELLCKGRILADQWGTQLGVLLIGSELGPLVKSLSHCGADVVLTAEHPNLYDYSAELYSAVITSAVNSYGPSLLLMGYTYLGMEVGPAVSVRLGGTMVTNCTELNAKDGKVSVIRSMFGGTLQAGIELEGPAPYIVSIEKGILPREMQPSKEAVINPVSIDFAAHPLRSKIIEILTPDAGDIDITKAKILVSAGRGVGGPDKIQIIRDLSDALGGAVACSRPVADMGWLGVEHQVGISANTISPDIYIACGISGASQHVTAMRDSGTIIAINKDPNAPIFRVADYGVIGDLFEVVPALIKEAKDSS